LSANVKASTGLNDQHALSLTSETNQLRFIFRPTINVVGSAPVKLFKPSRPPEKTNQQKTQRNVEHVEITNSKELHVMVVILTMMGLSFVAAVS
jgi:hypothetical protein